MININPPKKCGVIKNNKYVWNNAIKLPEYYNGGNDFIKNHLPNGVEGDYFFYMGDSEVFFKKKLKTMPDDWHYRNKKLIYTLNSLGFRTKEFNEIDWANSIIIFGCSCAFGVGVSNDETVSYYLQEITGKNVINLGVPGCSNQYILNLNVMLRKKYPIPYAVVNLWTTTDRDIFYNDIYLHHVGPWDLDNGKIDYREYYKNKFSSEVNEYVTFKNIVDTNRCIWDGKTKHIELSYFEHVAHYGELLDFLPFSNTARDLLHPGPSDHKEMARILYNYIQ